MDTKTKISPLEAGRVKTEMEWKHGKKIKYRELVGYTPEQVGSRYGIRPREIAEMAGRENGASKIERDVKS